MTLADDRLPLERGEGETNRTDARAAWQAAAIDASTRAILDADAEVFLHQSLSTPCLNVITHAEGATIVDAQGRRYLDFHGNAVHLVGYANPRVVTALRDQLDTLVFAPRRYANVPAIRLAQRLARLMPGEPGRVLLATSGAGAMSTAVQLARVATGRHRTISLWDSFHGGTLETIGYGGEAAFRAGVGPLPPGAEHVPGPDARACPLRCRARSGGCDLVCADLLAWVLERDGDVAAVIAEPVRATPVIPPPGWWETVRRACDRHGTLIIADEIPTGLGRTGDLLASTSVGLRPDIVVLGKALGGGLVPLAAVVARAGLNVAADRSIGHLTHEKSPVASAVGLAVLDEIEEGDLPGRARRLGAEAAGALAGIATRHPAVGEVRAIGLLLGLAIGSPPGTDADRRLAERILYAALDRGLSFKVAGGDIIQLVPPLTIAESDLRRGIAILEEAIGAAVGARPAD